MDLALRAGNLGKASRKNNFMVDILLFFIIFVNPTKQP